MAWRLSSASHQKREDRREKAASVLHRHLTSSHQDANERLRKRGDAWELRPWELRCNSSKRARKWCVCVCARWSVLPADLPELHWRRLGCRSSLLLSACLSVADRRIIANTKHCTDQRNTLPNLNLYAKTSVWVCLSFNTSECFWILDPIDPIVSSYNNAKLNCETKNAQQIPFPSKPDWMQMWLRARGL